MNSLDLHIHSKYSCDGQYAIRDILQMAADCGLKTIAITDHNSVKGVAEALAVGREQGIKVVPGIEIDCTFDEIDLHLLGYHIDAADPRFDELEDDVFRQDRAVTRIRMEKLLAHTDIKLDADALLAKWPDKIITAEMIAEEILSMPENDQSEFLVPYRPGGSRSDSPVHFHWDNFAQGKIAYAPVRYIPFQDAVVLIKSAGGIPVIAHAGVNLRCCLERVSELIDTGAEGLEIYNTYHTAEESRYLRRIAKDRHLAMTCGSDFHGKNKPNVQLGVFPMETDDGLGI